MLWLRMENLEILKILINKRNIRMEQIKDDFKDILKFSEISLRSVWDNNEDNMWNNYLKKL